MKLSNSFRQYLLVGFGISLAVSVSGALIFAGFFIIESLVKLSKKKRNTPLAWDNILIPFIFYAIWMITVSIIQGTAPAIKVISKCNALTLFILFLFFLSDHDIKVIVKGFLWGAVFGGFLGLLQVLLHCLPNQAVLGELPAYFSKYVILDHGRATGTRSHPLTYSETLLPAAVFIGAYLISLWNKGEINTEKGKKWTAGLLYVCAGLLFSQSRGSWLGALAGLLILLPVLKPTQRKIFFGMFVFVFGALLIISPDIRSRTKSIIPVLADRKSDRQSNAVRLELWQESIDLIRENPISGIGVNNVKLTTVNKITGKKRIWSESHNIYLQIAVEGGMVGLVLFLSVIGFFIWKMFLSETENKWVFFALIIPFLVVGLTESWIRDKEIALIFWAMLGACYPRPHKKRNLLGPLA